MHAASRTGSKSRSPAHFEHRQTDPSCSLCHISRKENPDPFVRSYQQDEAAIRLLLASPPASTTCELLVHARVGQGRFRARVLAIEASCRVTGIKDSNFLVASHIKPWSASDDRERLDGNNGLALAPHIDFLFDKGYLTFRSSGETELSDTLPVGVGPSLLPSIPVDARVLNAAQEAYMAYHRSNVFRRLSA